MKLLLLLLPLTLSLPAIGDEPAKEQDPAHKRGTIDYVCMPLEDSGEMMCLYHYRDMDVRIPKANMPPLADEEKVKHEL